MASEEKGPCIICGEPTTNRSRVAGRIGSRSYSHWRCPAEEFAQCADRRDMNRRRPKGRDKGLDYAISVIAVTGEAS